MELSLSLGDASKPIGLLTTNSTSKQNQTAIINRNGLVFCMAQDLNSNEVGNDKESVKNNDEDKLMGTPIQLDLLPLAPVPRQTQSLLGGVPRSSNNTSSENGSSGHLGLLQAGRGFNANKQNLAAGLAAEEVSSACHTLEDERASSRTSNEDENSHNNKKKLRLSKEQSAYLEENFKEHSTLNPQKQKHELAKQLNLTPRQVEVWFQNRRARTKLKQTEMDYEYFKTFCKTLTEENRRLHKELQELRALSSSIPLCMQLPATTLTMCPSCERVAAAPSAATTTAPAPNSAVAKDSTIESTTKLVSFPLFRPRFNPFPCSPTNSHQSAPS